MWWLCDDVGLIPLIYWLSYHVPWPVNLPVIPTESEEEQDPARYWNSLPTPAVYYHCVFLYCPLFVVASASAGLHGTIYFFPALCLTFSPSLPFLSLLIIAGLLFVTSVSYANPDQFVYKTLPPSVRVDKPADLMMNSYLGLWLPKHQPICFHSWHFRDHRLTSISSQSMSEEKRRWDERLTGDGGLSKQNLGAIKCLLSQREDNGIRWPIRHMDHGHPLGDSLTKQTKEIIG